MVTVMELPNGNDCTTRPRRRCRKLAKPNHFGSKTILERWHKDDNHCKSFSDIGLTEEQIFQYDELAVEYQYCNNRERNRNEKSLILSLKKGVQKTTESTSWFCWTKTRNEKTAWWTCERDPRRKYTDSSFTTNKTTKKPTIRRTWRSWLSSRSSNRIGIQHLRLHQLSENSTTIGSRPKVGILGDPHLGLNSSDFSVQRCFFACRQSTRCVDRYTCRTPHFHMHSHCTVPLAQWAWGPKTNCVPARHVSPYTSQYTEHQHKLSLSLTSPVFLSSSSPNPDLLSTHPFIHREDARQDGTSTEFHSSTGYEPKRIVLNRILVNPQNQIIDDQYYIEEIGAKPFSYSHSLIHSAYDSAEGIATPPNSDLEDKQPRNKLLHHCIYGNDRKMKDKPELVTLNEKAWWSMKYQGN